MGLGRCFAVAPMAASVLAAVNARAAQLRWSGPEDCAWSEQLTEQVEAQIEGPLAAVEGIDFEIVVLRENGGKWRLTLVSVERGSGERRKRQLRGESCSEVANAGAIALAMAIREQVQTATPETAPPQPAESPQPLPRPQPGKARAKVSAEPRPARTDSITPTITAGAVLDLGALPDPTFGAELGVGASWRALYLDAQGGIFAPAQIESARGRGGEFQLWVAGAVLCLRRPVARFAAFGCAAYEVGALSGRGTGISDPRSESTLWQALRADLGGYFPFGRGFAGVLRGGAVVPLARRDFVLDGSDVVHRPAALGARFFAGVSADF